MGQERPPVKALGVPELEAILAEVRFHDNWHISVWQGQFEGVRIRIVARKLLDSYDPRRRQDLGVACFVPPMFSEESFLRWLVWRIERIASHEVREHFTYKGERIYDPHVVVESEPT